jgi:hypothetical protein
MLSPTEIWINAELFGPACSLADPIPATLQLPLCAVASQSAKEVTKEVEAIPRFFSLGWASEYGKEQNFAKDPGTPSG